MGRLTVGVMSVIGLLTYVVTLLNGLADQWLAHHRQLQRDRQLYGRNQIVKRLMEYDRIKPNAMERAMIDADSRRNGVVH